MKYLSYILIFTMVGLTLYANDFPQPIGYINDYANVINQDDLTIMRNIIYYYEQETSIELSIATINNLQGNSIENYATELFNTWGIGKKGVNDGVLIFLSLDMNDRGLRIEVGYGLEEFLTDYQCSEIIDESMPLLKDGKYSTALNNILVSVKNVIGNRSKEMRAQYIAQRQKEKNELAASIMLGILYIFGIASIIFFFVFLYKLYSKRQKRLKDERIYLNSLLVDISSFIIQIETWIEYVKSLEFIRFAGADDVVAKLIVLANRLKGEISTSIKSAKKHDAVVKISNDALNIISKADNMVAELSKNKEIDSNIRKNLEDKITAIERKILGAIPTAKDTIDRINKNNPQSIWRGFDYNNPERQIEKYIDTAKLLSRDAIKLLNSNNFEAANDTATSALKNINNAYIFIQSIFDVEKQLNISKEHYNKYMTNIPQLISNAEQTVLKQHVKQNTKDMVDTIKQKYNELKFEIAKNDKNIDWIIIGALVISILNGCTDAISQSTKDIKNYHDEEEKEERRVRRRRDEASRSSYSIFGSGGGSSFGGFGGGGSGGGGSTGRF